MVHGDTPMITQAKTTTKELNLQASSWRPKEKNERNKQMENKINTYLKNKVSIKHVNRRC